MCMVAHFPFRCTEQPTFDGDELMLEIVGKDLICRLSRNLCTAVLQRQIL